MNSIGVRLQYGARHYLEEGDLPLLHQLWLETNLHDHTARVLLATSAHVAEWSSVTHFLGSLVEHLTLGGQGSRLLHKIVQLFTTLQDRLDCLVLHRQRCSVIHLGQCCLFQHHSQEQSWSHPTLAGPS